MSSILQVRLWRVEWFHRNGYQAQSQMFEAKKYKEVHDMAKENRLADFPESWSFKIHPYHHLEKVNGKWYEKRLVEKLP